MSVGVSRSRHHYHSDEAVRSGTRDICVTSIVAHLGDVKRTPFDMVKYVRWSELEWNRVSDGDGDGDVERNQAASPNGG